MSSFDAKKNRELDYQESDDKTDQFYETLTEYLILKDRHEEPIDAKILRIQAEKALKTDLNNFLEAYSFISTALKILKAYNNLL